MIPPPLGPSSDIDAAERFVTQQLSTVPGNFEIRNSLARLGYVGVWTKEGVRRGMRYGPFLGKWTTHAKEPSRAWEVSVTTHKGIRIVHI